MTRQINLFNPALRAKREWLTGKSLLAGIGVMVVLLGLYGGVVRWENRQLTEESRRLGAEVSAMREELTRLDQEIANRKVSSEIQTALQHAEATLRERERVVEALKSGALGSPEGFSEFLRAFARQARDGLWIVGLQMAEGGRDLVLEGRALDPGQIPGFIRDLNSESALRGRSFEALNVQLAGEEAAPARNTAQDAQLVGEAAVPARNTAPDAAPKLPPYHEFVLAATQLRPDNAAGGEAR